MVGAVVVKDGEIVSQGYHKRFGGRHAEVEAFRAAPDAVRGGTLYVNLEPCSHYGKQPPCVESIVRHGIRRVVIGASDPNPLVNGKGIAFLQEHGIEVRCGVLEDACKQLNEAYYKHIRTGLPFVALKIAQTLDARISARAGAQTWITSDEARRYVHRLRRGYDAVLVGVETVLVDNPQLTVRLVRGRHPRRVVLDSRLRIPLEAHLVRDAEVGRTILATTVQAPPDKIETLRRRGVSVWPFEPEADGRVPLKPLLEKMGKEGIASVLVEGGARVFTSFLRVGLVDRLLFLVAPRIFGAGTPAFDPLQLDSRTFELKEVETRRIGTDLLVSGIPEFVSEV